MNAIVAKYTHLPHEVGAALDEHFDVLVQCVLARDAVAKDVLELRGWANA